MRIFIFKNPKMSFWSLSSQPTKAKRLRFLFVGDDTISGNLGVLNALKTDKEKCECCSHVTTEEKEQMTHNLFPMRTIHYQAEGIDLHISNIIQL